MKQIRLQDFTNEKLTKKMLNLYIIDFSNESDYN